MYVSIELIIQDYLLMPMPMPFETCQRVRCDPHLNRGITSLPISPRPLPRRDPAHRRTVAMRCDKNRVEGGWARGGYLSI